MSDAVRERLVGHASMALAATSWGSLPVIIALADAPAPVLVAMRMGFGAVALGVFLAVFGRADLVPRRDKRLVAVLGVLLAISWVLFFRAIQLIGATAVLIAYLFPLLAAVSAPWVLGERREPHVLPLAAVGFAGLAVILAPEVSGGRGLGALLAVAVALMVTLLLLGARRVVAGVPGPVVSFWQSAIGAALLLPWALVAGWGGSVPWRWGALIGVVHTAVAGVLFFRAVGRVQAQEAGILMYLEPATAVGFVWLLQGDVPSGAEAVGGVLVVGAGIGLVLASARAARDVTPDVGLIGPG